MKTLRAIHILCSAVLGLLLACTTAASAQYTSRSPAPGSQAGRQMQVYIGTYTGAKSKGIYSCQLDLATGSLTPPELAAETASPSFLTIHPNRRFLYAVGEMSNFSGQKSGVVSAFAIQPDTGKLTLLNQQPSGGGGPCHLVTDAKGRAVLVANYGGGSIAALPIQDGGRLGEATAFVQHKGSSANPRRQEAPHAHGIYVDARNRFVFVPDLGLDRVMIYRFDSAKGSLTPNEPAFASVKPGAGPRHFALHPRNRFAYVINEMDCTVTAFSHAPRRGELKEIQTLSTMPEGETVKPGYSTAEIEVHPTGKFLYGSNRGHDSIVVYAIDGKTGRLTLVEHESTQGKIPRSFGIDPTGTFLLAANQDSHTVVVFRIDPQTGRLASTGNAVEVGAPVCVTFLSSGP